MERDGTRWNALTVKASRGAVTTMTAMPPEPGDSPQQKPALPVACPDVAATVRMLHRNQGWTRTAVTSFIAFWLIYGAYASAESQGTSAPSWFLDMAIAVGALCIVSIIAVVVCSARLRQVPPAVRAQATATAARHPGRPHAHHYPPAHLITWVLRWVGLVLILFVAVVSVPAVVDGAAYLSHTGKTATFDPVSYQTNCDRYSCGTITDGILETGGAGVSASWQNVVPLGKPFQVREPVWTWGLGASLIDSDKTAVIAIAVSVLIEAAAVLVLVKLVRLARSWRRHRQQRTAPTALSIS